MSLNNEKAIGIDSYLTDTPGLGGRLRKRIEDFVVVEKFKEPPPDHSGRFSIATIRVKNWETNRLIRRLSMEFGIDRKDIGFAGTKDKRAITTQMMSFPLPPATMRELDIKDIQILDVYLSRKNISLGDLLGNSFEVVVRDFTQSVDDAKAILDRNMETIEKSGGFLNYFGIQRFGAIRTNTHIVGEHIVKRDFKQAVMAYIGNPLDVEDAETIKARKMAEECRDWKQVIEIYPPRLTFERSMIGHLIKRPDDYLGALLKLPRNLLLMFIHAYQSRFFNEIITERVKRKIPVNVVQVGDLIATVDEYQSPNRRRCIPVTEGNIEKIQCRINEGKAFITAVLIGSEVELAQGVQGEIERGILAKFDVDRKRFNIPEIPRISSKGMRREIIASVNDLSYDINSERIRLKFELFKGCYATSLLRELLKVTDITMY